MRYDRNFNPEWGCLGPAPSAMRTARLIGIAVIIGATVGGATVFSLLDRPLAEGSVAARTLVAPDSGQPLKTGTSVAAQQPVGAQQIKSPAEAEKSAGQKAGPASADGAVGRSQPRDATPFTPERPSSPVAFTQSVSPKEPYSAQASNDPVAVAPDPAVEPKPESKKPRLTSRSPSRTRYDARRYGRYFNAPRYGYEPRFGYGPRYDARGSLAWAPYY
jgi:hypothetical protein